jgi:hypothetical protein
VIKLQLGLRLWLELGLVQGIERIRFIARTRASVRLGLAL